MIKRDTDVEVVSKATTNQRIGRTNVQLPNTDPSAFHMQITTSEHTHHQVLTSISVNVN